MTPAVSRLYRKVLQAVSAGHSGEDAANQIRAESYRRRQMKAVRNALVRDVGQNGDYRRSVVWLYALDLVNALLDGANPPAMPDAVAAESKLLRDFRSLPRSGAFEVLRQRVPELESVAEQLRTGRIRPNDDIPEILQRALTQRGISKEEWKAHGVRQDVLTLAYLRNLVQPMVGPDAVTDDPIVTSAVARTVAILSLQELILTNEGGSPSTTK